MKYVLIAAMACTALAACQKGEFDYYNLGFKHPVFTLSISEDGGAESQLTAGTSGYYLFAKVEQDQDGVLNFIGTFNNVECPLANCAESVSFVFRNNDIANVANTRPELLFPADSAWAIRSPLSDTLALGTVAITWVKPNGKAMLTQLAGQTPAQFFKVGHSEPWETNENGQKTWKMDVNFSCMALDTATMQVKKINGSGTIAVAYR
jgi:hypothetical protein